MKQLQIIGWTWAAAVIGYALWQGNQLAWWWMLILAVAAVAVPVMVVVQSAFITAGRLVAGLWGLTVATSYLAICGWWVTALTGFAALFGTSQWVFKAPHPIVRKLIHAFVPASASERRTVTWLRRNNAKQGVASAWDVARRASAVRAKLKAKAIRPELADTWWKRILYVPATAVAVRLGRVGFQPLYATHEDFVLVVGGPRTGKTGTTCGFAINFPGALIMSSTRVEIIKHTAAARSEPWQAPKRFWHGNHWWQKQRPAPVGERRPIHIFNAGGEGGDDMQSSITFPVLDGCEDPEEALNRGKEMSYPLRNEDPKNNTWVDKGGRYLGWMFHAARLAALDGDPVDLLTVNEWIADIPRWTETIQAILTGSPDRSARGQLGEFLTLNGDTRTSVTNHMMQALAWMSLPAAKHSAGIGVDPDRRPGKLDIAKFVRERGTLYLIGKNDPITAPLVSALTAHVARWTEKQANSLPNNRHTPAVGIIMDEVVNGARVPLPEWSSYFGGNGIWLCAIVQSQAQLRGAWSGDHAAIIKNCAWAIMYLGGNKDVNDLDDLARLSGPRDETVPTTNKDGQVVSHSTRPVQVITVAQLARLAPGKMYLWGTGMPPALGKTRKVWDHPRYAEWVKPESIRAALTPVIPEEMEAAAATESDRGRTPWTQ